jgi:hypothetical protein
MFKNVAKTPVLTLRFGNHSKAVISVLTRVTGCLQKLISSFFSSPFHKNSRLLLDVVSLGSFFIGMAYSLSLSAVTIKKVLL